MALTYFTLAELRALPQMSDATRYTDARCIAVGEGVESLIELHVGTSFVARTITGEVYDGGRDAIVLRTPYAISVTSATENGTAVTGTLRVDGGVLRRFASATSYTPVTWTAGAGNVAVTYSAGYSSTPPSDVKEAALQATRSRLLATASAASVDGRRTTMNSEAGTVTYAMAGAEAPFGLPDVDAVVMAYKRRLNTVTYP